MSRALPTRHNDRAKCISLEGDTVVKVLVGDTSVPAVFYEHRKKLCDTTKIFTVALQKSYFLEGVENTFSFSEQEPATIRSFFHWLYERDLVKNHSEGKDTSYFHRLIKL